MKTEALSLEVTCQTMQVIFQAVESNPNFQVHFSQIKNEISKRNCIRIAEEEYKNAKRNHLITFMNHCMRKHVKDFKKQA